MDRQWWSMMFNERFMMIYVFSHSVGMHITMGSGGSSRERWEKGRSTSAEWPLIEQWPIVTKNLVDWWKKGWYIYLSYTTQWAQWLLRISMHYHSSSMGIAIDTRAVFNLPVGGVYDVILLYIFYYTIYWRLSQSKRHSRDTQVGIRTRKALWQHRPNNP